MNGFMQVIKKNKQLAPPSVILILSMLIIPFARYFEVPFERLMSSATYLTWHNFFEINSTVCLIAIFLILHHTYTRTRRLKTIVIGNMLLITGIVNVFHMLSYKGMPDFFTENTGANRATTFWIAARFIFALGFLIGGTIHENVQCKIPRNVFLILSLTVASAIFAAVIYYPACLPAMYVEGKGLTPLKIALEYVIIAMLLAAAALYIMDGVKRRDNMLLSLSISLLIFAISEFAFTIYVDVYDIYNYAGHLLAIIALYMATRNTVERNVLEPFNALTAAQKELRDHVENQEKTIEQRTRQLKIMNSKLIEDLEYARGIQKSLLPVFLPDTPEIAFSAIYLPTERIGGDFYDIFRLDERRKGFYISDVSGHGVPAAMLTVFLKQCIDNIIKADRRKNTLSSPAEMLRQVYEAFNLSNFRDEVYIVLIYCVYDMDEKKLICSSAGMNVMPLLADREGNLREIELKGFPICKLSGLCMPEFADREIGIQKGDRLYLCTDGLPEARNAEGERYSEARLRSLLSRTHERKLSEQESLITDDLIDFCASSRIEDDVTLLAVEFRE